LKIKAFGFNEVKNFNFHSKTSKVVYFIESQVIKVTIIKTSHCKEVY